MACQKADLISRVLFLVPTPSRQPARSLSPVLDHSPPPGRRISRSRSVPPVSSLNNKYERVLREYPEGAISGVQASDHPLAPFETVLRLAPVPAASSTTRNASLIHLEARRGSARLWTGGAARRGSHRSLYGGCFLFFPFLFVFFGSLDERASNRRMS